MRKAEGVTMRKFGVIFGLIGLVIATSLGITFWSALHDDKVVKLRNTEQENTDLQKAQQLVAIDKADEALPIIQKYKNQIESASPMGLKWLDVYIKTLEKEKNTEDLSNLFDFYPNAFKNNEDASLLLANQFILKDRAREFENLRKITKGNETQESAWFVLDADYLLLQGKNEEAIGFLKSRSFQGKNDTGRLIRLALLKANATPKESWKYLTEAYEKDPYNVDIRTYRARLLENAGKNDQALIEYQAAFQLLPSNLYLKDQLAEFYIRQKEFPLALDLLKTSLSAPTLDTIWVKSYFWNKVIHPIAFNWKSEKIPNGNLEPLISYYIHLNQKDFWDNTAFSKLTDGSNYLKTEQSTFWLRLLQSLKEGNEKEASNLLTYNPFATSSWNPELETALKYTLNYRKEHRFVPGSEQQIIVADLKTDDDKNVVNSIIEIAKESQEKRADVLISKSLHDLLISNEIYAALLLTTDWTEAALQLASSDVIPNGLPEWFTLEMVQAYDRNRGTQEALDFASKQTATPSLILLKAELFISENKSDDALESLKELYTADNDIGSRAAWLASLIYIEKKEYQNAKNVITANQKFANSNLGKETLGRIAVYENDHVTAESIYSSIEASSAEARSYLAKKAYAEKNWPRARELTEHLINEFPDNEMLKENLKRIASEEKKQR